MILEKAAGIPDAVTGGLDTVAVRFPSHRTAAALIRAGGGLIAAPSANRSGRPSPTTAAHCVEDLNGRVDMIIDGGEVGIGLESSIIDLTEETPVLLRPGYVTVPMLRQVLGEVSVDASVLGENVRPKAPGMKYRHYAPKGKLFLVKGERSKVAERINKLLRIHEEEGCNTAVIASHEDRDLYRCEGPVIDIGSLEDEDTIAHRLFSVLRDLDECCAEYIYSECYDTPRLGKAIMDRLTRASGNSVINAE
jgi:L-threonylcarbamoyladenylate synthase